MSESIPPEETPPDTDAEPDDQDRDEMMHQEAPEPDRSLTFRLTHFVVENLLIVLGGAGLIGFGIIVLLDVGVPRWVRLMGVVTALTLPLVGRPAGKKVADILWNPTYVWLVDVDARHLEAGIFRIPAQRFREWDVEDGSLDWCSPHLAFGKNVDLIAQTVDGTWRGTMSDRELMRAFQKVEECRSQLEDDAKRGFAIEAQAFTIVRRGIRDGILQVVDTFESGSLPAEGDELTDKIDSAVEQFGLERKIRTIENEESPESDVPGGDVDRSPAADGLTQSEAIDD